MSKADEGLAGEEKPSKRSVSLWFNRDYMLLWSGQVISSAGTQFSQLAFPLLVLFLTKSPALTGYAGALRALPYLIFSLPAGALIDRWDRKQVMILCDIGRSLSMASIPFAIAIGQLTVLQLYIVSVIEGILFVFFNIAEVACLPNVVTKEQLPAASAQNMATDGITSLIGPPLGGALFNLGIAFPFVGDAISYAASVISLFFIKTRFQEKRIGAQRSLWIEIREGLIWLWKQPLIRFIAILTGGSNLISSGFALIIILLAQQMHASAFTIGVIFAIGGIGGILGAIVATSFQKRFSFGQVIIGTTWSWVIVMPLYLIAPDPFVLGILSAAFFITGPIYNVVQFSYRLSLIPDELQGRVNSVFRLIAFGGQPLGFTLTGLLLQYVGVVPTILFCTAGLLILAVAATLNPHVRHAKPKPAAER